MANDLYGWHDAATNPDDMPEEGKGVIGRFYLTELDLYVTGTGRFYRGGGWNVSISTKYVPNGPVENGSVILVAWKYIMPQVWMESKRHKVNTCDGETPWSIEVRSHKYIGNFIDLLREEKAKAENRDWEPLLAEAADELEQLLLESEGEKGYTIEEDSDGETYHKPVV